MRSLIRSLDGRPSVKAGSVWTLAMDLLGAALFIAAGGWMLWARVRSGGSAAPGVMLLAACGLVLIAARTFAADRRLLVPAASLLAAIVVIAWSRNSVVSIRPLAGPFHYQNADAAFYVQAAMAGFMLASGAPSRLVRAVGGAGAMAFASLPFFEHALAAAILVLLLPGMVFALAGLAGARAFRISVAILGSMFAAAVVGTIVMGARYSSETPGIVQRAAVKTVDRERVVLWHDAFVIMREHPATGVGPGRYQEVSPIASRDPDYRWAHNEFLQQGAEGGIVGLVLLVALFGWIFARLWMVRAPDVVTALSAASLAALGIHACLDYVMHFPAIPVVTAALVATGMIERTTRSSSDWGSGRASERNDLTQARTRY